MRAFAAGVVTAVLSFVVLFGVPAQAAFRLEWDEDAPRQGGIVGTPSGSKLLSGPTTAVLSRSPARNRNLAPRVRYGQGYGEYHGPSTNPNVSPWGCEAEHAQQWSSTGKYWGKYQFDRQTWAAHGGDPSAYGSAPESVQDAVASRVSYDAWPNC